MNLFKWLPLVVLGLLPTACSAQVPVPQPTPVDISQNPQIQAWLRRNNPAEFTGKTWARFRITEPANLAYSVIIDNETNPYKPLHRPTGTVWAGGLQPVTWPEGEAWGKPLPWVAPATNADWLRAGQWSVWVELPVSKSAQWHTAFVVRPQVVPLPANLYLNLELATQPAASGVFYTVREPIDSRGTVAVRMPIQGGLAGLKMVESFTDWARRRRQLAVSLNLPPAPRATHLRFGTWASHSTYRAPTTGGSSSREQAEPDFQTFADLGLNSVTPIGLDQQLFSELARKYGMVDTSLVGWTSMWRYTSEGYDKQYEYRLDETPPQRWERVFEDYYQKMAARLKVQQPYSLQIADHFNLGDEIMPVTQEKAIRETPQLLAYFRSWLQSRKPGDPTWTPQFFGATRWDQIEPLQDRSVVDAPGVAVTTLRRYYWTWRFSNDYDIMHYKTATSKVEKYFPNVKMIAVNYQAGPIQNGFMGNNNRMTTGNIDILEMGRQAAMTGVMLEDWVASTDLGAGFTAFGTDVMRAAARKYNLPLSAYVVGSVPRPRFYSWMMQGVKEFGFYLYGPISNIGEAWAEHAPTLRQITQLTTEAQKFEEEILQARLRPTRVAMLIANTSDIMQRHGMYFSSERQQLYLALRHSGVPVDLVSEQDILHDGILKNYGLLYVSDPQVRSDVQRAIVSWVQGGGRLWAQVGAMSLDEYSQPSSIMNPVFGVSQNNTVLQPGGFRWASTFFNARIGKFNFTRQGTIRVSPTSITTQSEIPVWGMRMDVTPTSGRVIGRYDDGKPAIIVNSFVHGTAVLVGALTGEAYVRERYTLDYPVKDQGVTNGTPACTLATALLTHAGITRPVELSVPGILTSVMDAPGASLVFLNKAHEAPVGTITVRLQQTGRVSQVKSAKLGRLPHQLNAGVLTVQVPLEDSDILRVTHGP